MRSLVVSHFFFNDTATTEICTLSLHDALPISYAASARRQPVCCCPGAPACRGLPPCSWACCCCQPGSPHTAGRRRPASCPRRSEENTTELPPRQYLVCRLLLEKKHSCPGPSRR